MAEKMGKESDRQSDVWLPATPAQDAGKDIVSPLNDTDRQALHFVYAPATVPQRLRVSGLSLFERPLDILAEALATERDRGAAFLWAPVWFGIGCLIYFNLPREPLIGAFPALAAVSALLAWRIGRGHMAAGLFVALALAAAGASVAQLKTRWIDTVVLSRAVIVGLSGIVERVERRANGRVRYTIDVSNGSGALEGRDLGDTIPSRVRLTARRQADVFTVRDKISGKARLGPSPGPVYPGAYDFSFHSWFQGIGGSGFFLGKPVRISSAQQQGFDPNLVIGRIRQGISDIIRQALPNHSGALAAALIVGDRSGIDEKTAESLRSSGLAHILAISGLHMALVAATVIVLLRRILSLFPAVALAWPIRKWAAGGALFAASAYLLISGASVSTQRAFVMVAIMLMAVMLDRRAVTMRNVAVAAFVVLILAPQAILSPGFQMSFAAVAALVASYEILSKRSQRKGTFVKPGRLGLIKRLIIRDLGGLATTSLVAGIATGIFAAYHFHRVAPFGLLANLLAMPLVSIAVMPLALLSTLAMPFGLEKGPLILMAYATGGVVDVADWVARLGPSGNTGRIPVAALLAVSGALLLCTLGRTRLRLLALPCVGIAAFLLADRATPDLVILESGRQFGAIEQKGMRLLRPAADKFSTTIWKHAFSPAGAVVADTPVKRGKPGKGFRCDDVGCVTQIKGAVVAHVTNTAHLTQDCRAADVLIIPYSMPHACTFLPADQRPLIIEGETLRTYGAHTITFADVKAGTGKGGRIVAVQSAIGTNPRPWTRHRFQKP